MGKQVCTALSKAGREIGFRVTDLSQVHLYVLQGNDYTPITLTAAEARELASQLMYQANVVDHCNGVTDIHPDDPDDEEPHPHG